MESTLVILKFGGLLVAGSLGILGTLFETHMEVVLPPLPGSTEPIRKRILNRGGRWVLGLTILGLAVGLASQIAEEIIRKGEEKDAIDRTEAAVNASNKILEGLSQQAGKLERTLQMTAQAATKFQDFSIDLRFELPSNDALRLSVIQDRIERILRDEFDGTTDSLPNGLSVQREFPRNKPPIARYVVVPIDFEGFAPDIKVSDLLKQGLGAHVEVFDAPSPASNAELPTRSRILGFMATGGERRLFFDIPRRRWLMEFRKMRIKTVGRPSARPAIGWSDLLGTVLRFRFTPLGMSDGASREAMELVGIPGIARLRLRLSTNLILEFKKSQIDAPTDASNKWYRARIPDTEDDLLQHFRFEVISYTRSN